MHARNERQIATTSTVTCKSERASPTCSHCVQRGIDSHGIAKHRSYAHLRALGALCKPTAHTKWHQRIELCCRVQASARWISAMVLWDMVAALMRMAKPHWMLSSSMGYAPKQCHSRQIQSCMLCDTGHLVPHCSCLQCVPWCGADLALLLCLLVCRACAAFTCCCSPQIHDCRHVSHADHHGHGRSWRHPQHPRC